MNAASEPTEVPMRSRRTVIAPWRVNAGPLRCAKAPQPKTSTIITPISRPRVSVPATIVSTPNRLNTTKRIAIAQYAKGRRGRRIGKRYPLGTSTHAIGAGS